MEYKLTRQREYDTKLFKAVSEQLDKSFNEMQDRIDELEAKLAAVPPDGEILKMKENLSLLEEEVKSLKSQNSLQKYKIQDLSLLLKEINDFNKDEHDANKKTADKVKLRKGTKK
jgi:hypothetical protein